MIQRYTTSDGVQIAYRIVGSGPEAITLLPGWPCTSASFRWLLPYFDEKQYTLLLPDLRGSGESDKPATGYTIERASRDILELLSSEGWHHSTLVGHGSGGTMAQWLAADPALHPGRLIMAAPVPAGVPLPTAVQHTLRDAMASTAGMAALWQHAWSTPLPLALLDALLGDAQTWQPAALLALADSWHQTSRAERLPTIRTPTLVVGAEHEPWLTAELLHRHVVTPIPGARFVNVPNSSQYMHIEQAAFTAGLIIGFLAAD